MLRTCLIWILVLALGWFAVFGGQVFGPRYQQWVEEDACRTYLRDCRPDEIRFQQFIFGREAQRIAFSFTTRQFSAEPVMPDVHYDLFWMPVKSIFHTTNFPPLGFKPPIFDEARLAQVRAAMEALPPPSEAKGPSFRQAFHVAFYRAGTLQIDALPKSDVQETLHDLFTTLGLTGAELNLGP